jgi:UDP-glucose 4-epimerase
VRAIEVFDQVIEKVGQPSVTLNVGRGDGVTVRELVAAFDEVIGREVPVDEAPPRPGDAIGSFANVDRAAQLLGWRTQLGIEEAIASALAWADKRHDVLGYE